MDSTLALGAFRIAKGAGGEGEDVNGNLVEREKGDVWNRNSCVLIDYRLWAAKSEGRPWVDHCIDLYVDQTLVVCEVPTPGLVLFDPEKSRVAVGQGDRLDWHLKIIRTIFGIPLLSDLQSVVTVEKDRLFVLDYVHSAGCVSRDVVVRPDHERDEDILAYDARFEQSKLFRCECRNKCRELWVDLDLGDLHEEAHAAAFCFSMKAAA